MVSSCRRQRQDNDTEQPCPLVSHHLDSLLLVITAGCSDRYSTALATVVSLFRQCPRSLATPARFETEQLEEYAAKEPLGLDFKRASDAAPAAGSQDAQEPQGAAVSGACWHQVCMKGENSKPITKTGIH